MEKKNKLTREVQRRIRKIAQACPPLEHKTRTQRIRIAGSKLLSDNPEAKDDKGKPIDPKLVYIDTVALPVNHEKELEQVYIIHGWAAVNNYVVQAQQLAAEALAAKDGPRMQVLPL